MVAGWVENLRDQISRFLDLEGEFGVTMVNNLDWIGEMSALQFLRDIGKNFRIGAGYNFTEFSDDLTDFDYDHEGWFLNMVGMY